MLRSWFWCGLAQWRGLQRSSPPTPWRRVSLTLEVLEGRLTPTIINVTTTLDVVDPNDRLISLREAIDQANADPPGDVIQLQAGTYTLTIANAVGHETANASGDLNILQSMTLQGLGTAATILDGNGGNLNDRVLEILPSAFNANPQVTMTGLTIENGRAPQAPAGTPDGTAAQGGGLYNGGTLTLYDVAVTSCVASRYGGGIANDGTLTLQNNCVLSGNLAIIGGGGLFNDAPGTVTSLNSLIQSNEADLGGGVLNGIAFSAPVTLTMSSGQVSTNIALLAGGGIDNAADATANLTGTLIFGNLAAGGEGGGLVNSGTATLNHVGVVGNTSTNGGGGIWNAGGSVSSTLTLSDTSYIEANNAINGAGLYNGGNGIVNAAFVTIAGNAALGGNGGGIFNDHFGTLNLYGVAIVGNSAANGGGIFNFFNATVHLNGDLVSGNNVTGAGGGIYNAAGDDNFQPGVLDGSGSFISKNIAGSTDANAADGPFGGGLLNAGDRSGLQATILDNFGGSGAGFHTDDLGGV
jgi:hypothetical protein